MDPSLTVWLALLMGAAAVLYSSVGHGGASAYLAIMALFAVSPEVMRPTALALNIIVSAFAVARFGLGRQVNWRLVLAFASTAAPAAFIGGTITLPAELYRPIVGLMLWCAAIRLVWQPERLVAGPVKPPRLSVMLPTGGLLGFLAGLTGTGGGIFLSPVMILARWEEPRRASGVAAAFILINSLAGLAGNVAQLRVLPPQLPWFAFAVAVGAALGTWLGSSRLPRAQLLRLLGLVLLIAGAKLILS